jgi:type III pantothenate kinase
MPHTDLLLISVGNTRTRLAGVTGGKLDPARAVPNEPRPALLEALSECVAQLGPEGRIVLASVNEPIADELAQRVTELMAGPRLTRLGKGLRVPIEHDLPAPVTVGIDRLLNALGAYTRSGEPCVVIDAGTAVTVDLVNAQGRFEGGVIAPGLSTMLWSLHQRTSALPELPTPRSRAEMGEEPLGNTTAKAMTIGCVAAVRGLARLQIDRYAERLGTYPRVVATGGDAALVFEDDDLVEHIVPDLTLIGMLAAWNAHAARIERDDRGSGA